MKTRFSFIFIITSLFFASFGFSQKLYVATLDSFWKLFEVLKKGDSLSAEKWANFLDKEPWITYKVYVYKKYEKELKAYQQKLLQHDYIDMAIGSTFNWLPKRLQVKDADVTVSYLAI